MASSTASVSVNPNAILFDPVVTPKVDVKLSTKVDIPAKRTGTDAEENEHVSFSNLDGEPSLEESSTNETSKKPRKDVRDGYQKINKDNPRFTAYVKSLDLIPPEEWDLFWETVREALPSTFRVTGFRRDCEALKAVINNHFLASLSEESASLCQAIPWYPEQLAWQINIHRRHIKRNEDFKKLREFIINETASGNISRQETVSMIPPLLLDVKPGHKVLDMCAAPGSKTAQIIDMLQGDLRIPAEGEVHASIPYDFVSEVFKSKFSISRQPVSKTSCLDSPPPPPVSWGACFDKGIL